jgi:hypothetical protein
VLHTLTFGLAGSQRGDTNTVLFGIDLDSDSVLEFSATAIVGSPQGLTTLNLPFTPLASTTSARIVFDNTGGDNFGALLDNVVLDAAVVITPPPAGSAPEPGMLALVGLSVLGLALIRKRGRQR